MTALEKLLFYKYPTFEADADVLDYIRNAWEAEVLVLDGNRVEMKRDLSGLEKALTPTQRAQIRRMHNKAQKAAEELCMDFDYLCWQYWIKYVRISKDEVLDRTGLFYYTLLSAWYSLDIDMALWKTKLYEEGIAPEDGAEAKQLELAIKATIKKFQ